MCGALDLRGQRQHLLALRNCGCVRGPLLQPRWLFGPCCQSALEQVVKAVASLRCWHGLCGDADQFGVLGQNGVVMLPGGLAAQGLQPGAQVYLAQIAGPNGTTQQVYLQARPAQSSSGQPVVTLAPADQPALLQQSKVTVPVLAPSQPTQQQPQAQQCAAATAAVKPDPDAAVPSVTSSSSSQSA